MITSYTLIGGGRLRRKSVRTRHEFMRIRQQWAGSGAKLFRAARFFVEFLLFLNDFFEAGFE